MFVLGCALGCDGGPTSGWPRGRGGNEQGTAGSPRGPIVGGPNTGGRGEDNDPPGGSASGGTVGGSGTATPGAGGGTVGTGGVGGGVVGGASPGGSPGGAGSTAGGGSLSGLVGGTQGALGGTIGGMGAIGGLLGGGGGTAGGSFDAGAPPQNAGDAAATALDGAAGPDAALPDAGPHDAGSAADAGFCPTESSASVDGGCQGSYCSMTLDALGPLMQPGVCSGEATLRLVCDAQLARKTAQCAQDNALSLALGSSVRNCLRRDPQLAPVSAGCVDCYVAELLCTLSNCLATCVAGFDPQCTSCRRESCGAEFTRCSGLPAL